MKKKLNIIKVTLCCPGDIQREIIISREVIAAWNQKNEESSGRRIEVFNWSTDCAPTMEERGQAAINRKLIDDSDIIIAIFWNRLGTPTGLAGSGTEEEITRAIARDIRVMPYFSKLKSPYTLPDPEQLQKLEAFRMKMRDTGLPGTFNSRQEFRKLLGIHLDIAVSEVEAKRLKNKKPTKKKGIRQKAEGDGNIQSAGDNNTFNIKVPRDKSGKSSRELPGTIGADADMRTYAIYLVGKYIKARQEGEKRVKQHRTPFNPGSAHSILGQGFGVTNSVLQISQASFFLWIESAQNKIRRTVFAKKLGHEFFHSWEEHLRQRGHDI